MRQKKLTIAAQWRRQLQGKGKGGQGCEEGERGEAEVGLKQWRDA